jgi:hypothetical protein
MNYEIHITVNTNDVEKFKSDCYSIGVKPIVIETQNKNDFGYQVMTSSTHHSENYTSNLDRVVGELQFMGYDVIRQKVEREPERDSFGIGIKHNPSLYYESHLRLKLPIGYDLNPFKEKITNKQWHFSKNLFKQDETYYYQMLTYRESKLDLEPFEHNISLMKLILDLEGIVYDKIEIEECIYDTNINIDHSWLGK